MAETNIKHRSQRQLMVGETLKHALSNIFMREDIYGPNGENVFITISEVQISPDLKNATVFFMPLGGKDKENTKSILDEIAPKIRSVVSKNVRLRHTPALSFKLDDTFDNASKMQELIDSDKDN